MLELSSNTIKVLGIFGRLSTDQEAYFNKLEAKYSNKPKGGDYDIFRHLTLTFIPNAQVGDVNIQLDILKELKQFLPLKIRVKQPFVKDEESLPGAEHIALEFDLSETDDIVSFIGERCPNVVATWYIKIIWFVPKENQKAVIDELSKLKEIEFTDFYLVSNKQNDANTIYKTSSFFTT